MGMEPNKSHVTQFTSLTPQQVSELANPCKEFAEMLETYIPPKLDWTKPEKALDILRNFVKQHVEKDSAEPDVEEETMQVNYDLTTHLPIKIFRKAGGSSYENHRPLVVLYFPGGFIMGDPMTLAPLARSIARRFNVIVACPTYRLAPEHQWPTPVNDSWNALRWLAEHCRSIHADPTKGFVVGGISSGGNIANTVAHWARDKDLQPPLTGVWLSCAGARLSTLFERFLPEKYRERYLSRQQTACIHNVTVSWDMEKYKRDALKPLPWSVDYAPLIYSANANFGHEGFPKTYFQVAGMDMARDEILIFDEMLKSQGIATRLDLYKGLPHFFWYTFRDLPQSKTWEKDTLDKFEWLLDLEA